MACEILKKLTSNQRFNDFVKDFEKDVFLAVRNTDIALLLIGTVMLTLIGIVKLINYCNLLHLNHTVSKCNIKVYECN